MNSLRRISRVTGMALLGAGLAGCQAPAAATERSPVPEPSASSVTLGAFAYVTVGTADLDGALAIWRDRFALDVVASRDGPDPGLAALWDLSPGDIARQAVLRTPGVATGALHLVEFAHPGPPVRADAEVFDRVPKNLDVYARDLPARYEELRAAGLVFRAPWAEMPAPGGLSFREAHMAGPDATNIVLLEILGTAYRHSATGYAGIGPLIIVVADAASETAFYREVLGLQPIMEDLLAGPEIERVVGLPAGAGIDFRVLGDAADPMGRIEVIEYQRTGGADLFTRARPPATGTLHAGWRVPALAPVLERLESRGIDYREYGVQATIHGTGPVIAFHTPAGFRIEILASGTPGR
jgi:catechol 2,3-dioxygenase-like lactoylglutathione lyase family enzyme